MEYYDPDTDTPVSAQGGVEYYDPDTELPDAPQVNIGSSQVDLGDPTANDVLDMAGMAPTNDELKKLASPYVRTGLIGSLTPLGTGLGAASPMPGGAMLGGVTSFGIAEDLANKYDIWAGLKEPPKDLTELSAETLGNLKTGLLFELGVPPAIKIAEPVLGPIFRGFGVLAEDAKGAAKWLLRKEDIPKAQRAVGAAYYSLINGAKPLWNELPESQLGDLKEEIPGLELSLGQELNHRNTMAGEAAIQQKVNPGNAEVINSARKENNLKLVKEYFYKKMGLGGPGQEHFLDAIESVSEANKVGVAAAKEDLETVAGLAKKHKDEPIGGYAQKTLEANKEAKRLKLGINWEKMRDVDIPDGTLHKVLREWRSIRDRMAASSYGMRSVPKIIKENITMLERAMAGEKNSLGKIEHPSLKWLHERKKEIGDAAAAYRKNPEGLTGVKNAYNEAEAAARDAIGETMGDVYPEMNARWQEYENIYNKGPVGEILKPDKVTESDVLGKLLKPKSPEVAKKLVDAVGIEEARKIARHDALSRLWDKASGGELTPKIINSFYKDNEALLKELGIEGEFKSYTDVAKRYEDVIATDKDFQKSIASKLLGKDVGKAFQRIFSNVNDKSQKEILSDVVGLVKGLKGHPEAIQGLKNSLSDFILYSDRGELSFKAMEQKMKLFDPTLKLLYTPEELAPMYTARQALEVVERSAPPKAVRDGSGMMDKMINIIAPMIMSKYSRIIALKGSLKMMIENMGQTESQLMYDTVLDPQKARQFADAVRKEVNAEYFLRKNPAEAKAMSVYETTMDRLYGPKTGLMDGRAIK